MKDILFVEDWAEADDCSRQSVYNRINDGSIPKPIKLPGRHRPFWTRRMREDYLAKLEAEAAA